MSHTWDRCAPPANPPWGVPATLLWTLAALLVGMLAAGVALGLWSAGKLRAPVNAYDGMTLAIGTFVAVPVQIAVLVFAARMRRWPPGLYLSLVVPRRAEVVVATIAILVLNLVFDAILFVGGRDIVPPFQTELWRTAADAGWLAATMFAIVAVAPVGEEIAFRGFLFRGLARPGVEMLAIGAIALVWALLHIQYDWLGMAQVFLVGLVLGWFRWATGSVILAVAMHVLVNLQSMLETWIKMEFYP